MNPDLDTLATTVYVTVDDLLIQHPEWVPERPAVGIAPKLSDAELVTLAVIQSLLRYTSEARFLRYAHAHLRPWFPYLPTRSAYNRRLRRLGLTMQHIIAWLARDCPSWHDDLWLVDSTPVECGRSRTTQQRSEVGGWAEYGYCASHSRYFWGLRFHLVATPSGLPIAFALAPAKADERDIATEMIAHARLARAGQTLMADKGYRSASFEEDLNEAHMTLIRPATKTEAPRSGQRFLDDPSARSSNRSSKPSRANSISNVTADAPKRVLWHVSSNGYSPSPPSSGTTKPPNDQAQHAPSSHMTTKTLELTI